MIGITERGDAARDLSWTDSLANRSISGAILITKNVYDQDFQEAVIRYSKVKPIIVHATITGWGGTPMEPAVCDYTVAVNGVKELINKGFPATNVVIRVDPVIPTPVGIGRAANAISAAMTVLPDVFRYRMSIYDDYHAGRDEMLRRGYSPIDNFTKWKNEQERRPSTEAVQVVGRALGSLLHSGMCYETCAEPELCEAFPDKFKAIGCLSPNDYAIMGLVPPTNAINAQRRFGCLCVADKKELFNRKHPCVNDCAYCYWR